MYDCPTHTTQHNTTHKNRERETETQTQTQTQRQRKKTKPKFYERFARHTLSMMFG